MWANGRTVGPTLESESPLMTKRLFQIAGAVLFGAMLVIGLIILSQVPGPDRFNYPIPYKAVIGGSLAMFATMGGFVLAFIEAATQEE